MLAIHQDACLFLVNGSWNICYALSCKSEWLKITVLQNNWSQRTYPAWTRAVLQTVNIWLHRKSV